jgi:glycosyltransferase involved in cell wall biosynthesis
VAPSEHPAETWRTSGWPAKTLHVIPNGVDGNRFCPADDRDRARRELGLSPNATFILFVGRICPEKGVGDLIDAFTRIAVELPQTKLLLVGTMAAAYRNELDANLAKIEPNVRKRIIVRPVTGTPEKYLAIADLVCLPSTCEEAFPLGLIEAMAAGAPVVATRVGNFAEILGENHLDALVAPGDVAGLAERISWWLLRPQAGVDRGQQLRRRCLECFTSHESVGRYELLLESIVNSAPAEHPLYTWVAKDGVRTKRKDTLDRSPSGLLPNKEAR